MKCGQALCAGAAWHETFLSRVEEESLQCDESYNSIVEKKRKL